MISRAKLAIFSVSQNPEDYQLPSDYTFASQSWGDIFYKIHGSKMTYTAAKTQCESDGAFLAYPVSEAANDFIVSLIPNEDIWIGIDDIDQEGSFVSVDGREYWATPNWANNQPDNHQNNEDALFILGHQAGFWADTSVTSSRRFVCSLDVTDAFKVWHGNTDIAEYTVGSVNSWLSHHWQPEMMFDDPPKPENYYSEDATTLWNGNPCNDDRSNCLVTITFKVLSEFKSQFTSLKPHLE